MKCPTHGFENCPYHGGGPDRTPVGAFRFCACFANHDGRTPCRCACGQCEVYRDELARGPAIVETEEAAIEATPHASDSCDELCQPREKWLDKLRNVDTAAARSAIADLSAATTDVAIRAMLNRAEIVYFGELDRLGAQRNVDPTAHASVRGKRKKKSERGKPVQRCALCGVTHAPSFHSTARQRDAESALGDALRQATEPLDTSRRPDEHSGPDGDSDRRV